MKLNVQLSPNSTDYNKVNKKFYVISVCVVTKLEYEIKSDLKSTQSDPGQMLLFSDSYKLNKLFIDCDLNTYLCNID